MTYCNSGRHAWLNPDDAEKCCHPEWQRVLLVPWPGETLPLRGRHIVVAGTTCAFAWVRKPKGEEGQP